jgi:hypothetical protein
VRLIAVSGYWLQLFRGSKCNVKESVAWTNVLCVRDVLENCLGVKRLMKQSGCVSVLELILKNYNVKT